MAVLEVVVVELAMVVVLLGLLHYSQPPGRASYFRREVAPCITQLHRPHDVSLFLSPSSIHAEEGAVGAEGDHSTGVTLTNG